MPAMTDMTRFVDTHIHGAFGQDVSDGNPEGIVIMARRLPEFNVGAFCPTTMTISEDKILRSFEAVAKARVKLDNEGGDFAAILGVHLEGPFLSPVMSGVQGKDNLISPDKGFDLIYKLEREFPGLLKIIDIAPELPGGIDFIREFSKKYVISLAHTDAVYDKACEAFEAGAISVTHIMNAMRPCLKRDSGVLGAVMDYPDVYCEIICDGIHISGSFLKLLFRALPEDKIIVISDSMRGSGMPDGVYLLGDTEVECRGGRTYFGPGGNLAGSVTNMASEAQVLEGLGIPFSLINKALIENPLSRLDIML